MKARTSPTDPAARVRREVLRPSFDHLSAEVALWGPDDDPDRDTLAARVRTAVAEALTERQRSIVEWHFFEGLSQGQIARRLGVTQQVVQKSLYGVTRGGKAVGGALRRLREALGPHS